LIRASLCAGVVLAANAVFAAKEGAGRGIDLAYTTRVVAEDHRVREDSPFAAGLPLTTFGRDRARLEQEARGRIGPISLLATATVSGQEGDSPDAKLLANEAYADFRAGESHFTLGKKILSGDVGYGFRPIDVLQRESRLQVMPPTLEGIPHIAWERFSAESAWSLIFANPGHGRRGEAKEDGSVAVRAYTRAGGADLHGVARYSDRYRVETGAAVSAVPFESLELHGSFLIQRRGERQVPLTSPASAQALLDPARATETETLDWPRKVLAGFTWTWESGWSLLGEAWWDGTAPTAEDWRRLAAQADTRNALLGLPGVPPIAVAGSLAASTQLFQVPSVSRQTTLAHLGWTDPSGGGWTAALDLLRTLEDGGWSATAAVGRQADRLWIDAGIRRFGGRPNSAYRLLPERSIAFIGASYAF
jgi:hypothetical protein